MIGAQPPEKSALWGFSGSLRPFDLGSIIVPDRANRMIGGQFFTLSCCFPSNRGGFV